ncbi:MAG TPA: histidine phosphatase family protein [Ktedonobacteraceae bacterium]|nr:histidine phosphatase family protein [Ktedonobacteraceae bacterium]
MSLPTTKSPEQLSTNLLVVHDRPLPPNTKRIYLIRHARAKSEGTHTPMDPELAASGFTQLKALHTYFATRDVDLIVTSELLRAKATAESLQALHPNTNVIIEPDLNEMHTIGNWREYSAQDALRLKRARLYQPDQQCALGETPRQFHRRISRVWEHITKLQACNIAVVTHLGVLSVIIGLAFGLTENHDTAFTVAQPHAAVSELWIANTCQDPTLPDQVTIVRYLCYYDFLKPDLISY